MNQSFKTSASLACPHLWNDAGGLPAGACEREGLAVPPSGLRPPPFDSTHPIYTLPPASCSGVFTRGVPLHTSQAHHALLRPCLLYGRDSTEVCLVHVAGVWGVVCTGGSDAEDAIH